MITLINPFRKALFGHLVGLKEYRIFFFFLK